MSDYDDPLLAELLAKPVGNEIPKEASAGIRDFTNKLEVTGDSLTATIRDKAGLINEGRALQYIQDEGQDPNEWEVSSWYKVEYGPINESTGKPSMESVKFTFKRRAPGTTEYDIDEVLRLIEDYDPKPMLLPQGDHGYVVLIGDMQFFKMDGDGVVGTVKRTYAAIDAAADRLEQLRLLYDIDHIHIAWLGDHIEGFESQGGANVWRTKGTLNEQIRLTRRVMLHALKTFAPLARRVTMAAVPGNHGETVRFEGTGITRYDDSHDTEALIAVADAAVLSEKFEHVEFYVPDNDELIVVTEVANTVIAHHHGHKWKPNKQFEWWGKQAFNRNSPMQAADILVAGHLHHEHYETEGDRTYWGINALESESTWFRHTRGTGGSPGIHVGVVKDGHVFMRESILFYGTEIVA